MADGVGLTDTWPTGAHIKNLFVKDKAGTLTLITVLQERRVDLVKLGKHIGAKDRWSFADEDTLWRVLGVKPGAVTPLALINASPDMLKVIVDDGILTHAIVYAHPLINTQTWAMRTDDMLRVITSWGHTPQRINLGQFIKQEKAA